MRPLLPLWFLLACSGSDDGKDTGDTVDTGDSADSGDTDSGDTGETDDSGDTGETADSGDSGDSGETGDTGADCGMSTPVATLSTAIPTVFVVTWDTDAPGTSQVEWGYEGALTYRTWESTDTDRVHRVVVAGPAQEQEVSYRVRSVVDGVACVSETQTVTTGRLLDDRLPNVTLTESTEGAWSPGFRLLPYTGATNGVYLVDDRGRVVWARTVEEQLAPIKAVLDRDRAHILYMVEDDDRVQNIGGIHRVALDGSTDEFFPLDWNHHSFLQKEDGNILYLAADVQTVERYEVAADKVVEIDPTGAYVRTVFSAWDQYTCDLDLVLSGDNVFWPDWLDWTHGNSLNAGDDPGTYYLSFLTVNAIVKIDETGSVLWTLTGADVGFPTDWTFSGTDDERFEQQHNAHAVPGGMILFDNGAERNDPSEAKGYTLDEGSMTYRQDWSFAYDGVHTLINGDVQRLDNGNTLVNFGYGSHLIEATPAGEIVWHLDGRGGVFGFGAHVTELGGAL